MVYSTKERERWFTAEVQERLFPYLAGALNKPDSPAIKVGGHIDQILAALQAAEDGVFGPRGCDPAARNLAPQ